MTSWRHLSFDEMFEEYERLHTAGWAHTGPGREVIALMSELLDVLHEEETNGRASEIPWKGETEPERAKDQVASSDTARDDIRSERHMGQPVDGGPGRNDGLHDGAIRGGDNRPIASGFRDGSKPRRIGGSGFEGSTAIRASRNRDDG